MRLNINSQFFWNWCNGNPDQNSIVLSQWVRLVPNGHTLAGFVIGALCLMTMATLQKEHYTKLILVPK